MSDENTSMIELAVSTAYRADDTPVKRETTTNTFSGTRNRDDSCKKDEQYECWASEEGKGKEKNVRSPDVHSR
jgi:hypothetical protein